MTGTNEIALVTGANKGIGKEIARQLGALGATVLAGSRNVERGEVAVAELRAGGADVRLLQLDVTDDDSVRAAAKSIEQDFGRLDVLVNNAAISGGRPAAPSEVNVDLVRQVYDTNVFGVVRVTNAMLGLLRRSSAGRVVNLSTELGSLTTVADPACPFAAYTSVPYGSSKTALNALTVLYANELRDAGILVNSVSPGYCATDLNGHSGFLTAAQGAEIAVRLATVDGAGPTGAFLSADGAVPW